MNEATRRTMTVREFAHWRRRVERRRKVYLWGTPHFVTPRLCLSVWGDGKKWMAVQPIDARPNFYVVRVDSRTGDDGAPAEVDFRDILEDVLDELDDQFGPAREEDDGELRPWPAAELSNGVSWGELNVPTPVHRRSR